MESDSAPGMDGTPEAVPAPHGQPAGPHVLVALGAGRLGELAHHLRIVGPGPVAILGRVLDAVLVEEVLVDADGHQVDILGHAHADALHLQTFPLELVVLADLFLGHVAVDVWLAVEQQAALRPVVEDIAPGLEEVHGGAGDHLSEQLLNPAIRRGLDRDLDARIVGLKVLFDALLVVGQKVGAGARHEAHRHRPLACRGRHLGRRRTLGGRSRSGRLLGRTGPQRQAKAGEGDTAQERTTREMTGRHWSSFRCVRSETP